MLPVSSEPPVLAGGSHCRVTLRLVMSVGRRCCGGEGGAVDVTRGKDTLLHYSYSKPLSSHTYFAAGNNRVLGDQRRSDTGIVARTDAELVRCLARQLFHEDVRDSGGAILDPGVRVYFANLHHVLDNRAAAVLVGHQPRQRERGIGHARHFGRLTRHARRLCECNKQGTIYN